MESTHRKNEIVIARWQRDGGAPGNLGKLYQYGRRVEGDGSWTIYHVFTGVPAHIDSWTMTGLDQQLASDVLHILNRPLQI
ncbi:hypothetical protein [Ensifer adhaerens]|uniref:hypothetical protein n=1 Tax=Ensifer adhaerens TaxID=106592 RepID=UPI000FD900B4|nr:hypothetical protein [Ensifer adhaerens]MDF8357433.1 hypothetical protein [Ensifer adhaerens]THA57684.1 hypothetical protein E5176_33325 [Ensifer adhaerens]